MCNSTRTITTFCVNKRARAILSWLGRFHAFCRSAASVPARPHARAHAHARVHAHAHARHRRELGRIADGLNHSLTKQVLLIMPGMEVRTERRRQLSSIRRHLRQTRLGANMRPPRHMLLNAAWPERFVPPPGTRGIRATARPVPQDLPGEELCGLSRSVRADGETASAGWG